MFFALAAEPKRRFTRALLADKNAELVTLYNVIKADVEPFIDRLRAYQDDYYRLDDAKRRERFYEVRELDSQTLGPVERGARLLFLNRTCFNGLWRVNAAGRFNVPFGKYASPRILDVEVLRAAHEALSVAEIHLADFSVVTKKLERGDFAYFDPPYDPVSSTANFTSYSALAFTSDDQRELADTARRLVSRGVKVMLSNSDTPFVRSLYRGFKIERVKCSRAINSNAAKRGDVDEVIVSG